MSKYLLNCFWLVVPLLIWNIIFYHDLPQGYTSPKIWDAIPDWVKISENILRILVFSTPILLKLSIKSKTQRLGLIVYLCALLLYFSSWLVQIYLNNSSWSNSLFGFMAPAYTTLLIFIGIAIIGKHSFLSIPKIRRIYLIIAIAFVSIHTYHAYLAYMNLKQYL